MSAPSDKEHPQQQLGPADDLAATIEPTHSRDDAVPQNELPVDVENKLDDDGSASSSLSHPKDNKAVDSERPAPLTAVVTSASYATDASATARQQSNIPEKPEKPWYGKLNPLRWGRVPNVPDERTVSGEYGANWLSLLTFEWMTPLMMVSGKSTFSPFRNGLARRGWHGSGLWHVAVRKWKHRSACTIAACVSAPHLHSCTQRHICAAMATW